MQLDQIDLRAFGALEAKVGSLETRVAEQSAKIDQLLALANQGRGSLRVFLLAAGAAGGLVTWAVDHFLLK